MIAMRRASDDAATLPTRDHRRSHVVDTFARRIYIREMTKRLTELKVRIIEKVRQQIERSYKHEA